MPKCRKKTKRSRQSFIVCIRLMCIACIMCLLGVIVYCYVFVLWEACLIVGWFVVCYKFVCVGAVSVSWKKLSEHEARKINGDSTFLSYRYLVIKLHSNSIQIDFLCLLNPWEQDKFVFNGFFDILLKNERLYKNQKSNSKVFLAWFLEIHST